MLQRIAGVIMIANDKDPFSQMIDDIADAFAKNPTGQWLESDHVSQTIQSWKEEEEEIL